jgi:hypothetical protein
MADRDHFCASIRRHPEWYVWGEAAEAALPTAAIEMLVTVTLSAMIREGAGID